MIDFSYKKSSLIDQATLDALKPSLDKCAQKMRAARALAYDTDYASLNVLDDQELIAKVRSIAQEKKI